MIKLVQINGKTKKFMVKIQDKLFRWMRENIGVCEAAGCESLENSCLQINTKFKPSEG